MKILIRSIKKDDNAALKQIVQENLSKFHLDIPGTAYFDSELGNLSDYYVTTPLRNYFVLEIDGAVAGGVGVAEFDGEICELQKLYLSEPAKGNGYSKLLMNEAIKFAKNVGYTQMYLETHHNLSIAVKLYKSYGFKETLQSEKSIHSAMDIFMVKDLYE
jgi:putative acetyltransferase